MYESGCPAGQVGGGAEEQEHSEKSEEITNIETSASILRALHLIQELGKVGHASHPSLASKECFVCRKKVLQLVFPFIFSTSFLFSSFCLQVLQCTYQCSCTCI